MFDRNDAKGALAARRADRARRARRARASIDRLAERLAMTKGSFYHHFDGLAGYKSELLAYFGELSTMRYIEAVESEPNLDLRQKLNRLMALVLQSPDDERPLEVAFRGGPAGPRRPRGAASHRCHSHRLPARPVPRPGTPATTRLDMARALYTVLIGSGHIVPPLEPAELRRLWTLTLEVLPDDEPGYRVAPAAPTDTGQQTSVVVGEVELADRAVDAEAELGDDGAEGAVGLVEVVERAVVDQHGDAWRASSTTPAASAARRGRRR